MSRLQATTMLSPDCAAFIAVAVAATNLRFSANDAFA
jgi:hypothetical protein